MTTIKNKSKVLTLIDELETSIVETTPAFTGKSKKTIYLANKVKIVIESFDNNDSRYENGEVAAVNIFLGNKKNKVTGFVGVDYDQNWDFYPDEPFVDSSVYSQLEFQDLNKLWQKNKDSVTLAIQEWIKKNLEHLQNNWQFVRAKEALKNLQDIKTMSI